MIVWKDPAILVSAINFIFRLSRLANESVSFETIGSIKFNRRYFKRMHLYAHFRIAQA